MKITLFTCLLTLIPLKTLFAQDISLERGFELLKNKQFEKAYSIFQKINAPAADRVAAGYGTLLMANARGEFRPLMKAIEKYPDLHKEFEALPKQDKSTLKKKYGITASSLERNYEGVFEQSLRWLEKSREKRKDFGYFKQAVIIVPKKQKAKMDQLEASIPPIFSDLAMHADYNWSKVPAGWMSAPAVPLYRNTESPARFLTGINTKGSEFHPVLSADGNSLWFTGQNRVDNFSKEDIFVSKRQNDSTWSPPQLERFFSGTGNESIVAASADGQQLMLFIDAVLHSSHWLGTSWSEPTPVRLDIDLPWMGIASISRNGEVLIFEGNTSKAWYGNTDLYLAKRESDSTWSKPVLLAALNTNENERSPFIHSDLITLYFSSEHQPDGFGGLDVYKTTRLDDTWLNWSTPQNLGPEVNSSGDDWSFFIPPSGLVAYYSIELPGQRDRDLVVIDLPESARPFSAGQPEPPTIKIPETKTALTDTEWISRDTNIIALVPSGDTSYTAIFNLKKVQFDFGEYNLREDAKQELNQIFAAIEQYHWNIEIAGHTDDVGSTSANLLLSEQRAEAVRRYLIGLGYPEERISSKGYGAGTPIDTNTTETGRARNRRVEIRRGF